jgi:type IV secretion system protein VirD4
MGTDKEVILFEGIPHPVKCDKIRYYEDKRFTARLLPKVDVPMMQLEGSVPMGRKTIAMAAVTGMVLAGLAQVAAEPATTKEGGETTMKETPRAHPTNAAKDAFDRFFAFVSTLQSTSQLSDESVGKGMSIALSKGDGGSAYTSQDVGGGWTYAIERLDSSDHMKTGLTFGFYSTTPGADPTPICVASLADVRSAFVSRGFAEAITSGELGQVVAWNFEKNDLVFTVTPGDLAMTADRTQCVRVIHTTDGK